MKGLRVNFEVLIIGIFVLIFLMWAFSKCNSTKTKLQDEAAIEAKEDSLASGLQTVSTAPAPVPTTPQTPQASTPPAQPEAKPTPPAEPQYTRLYVTIDKLKLRKQPGLKGDLLGELKLFDEVYFMNEETDSTFSLNLGKEIANEPYVKIKTKKGTVGWVYGAGVHYAKKKRSGVLE